MTKTKNFEWSENATFLSPYGVPLISVFVVVWLCERKLLNHFLFVFEFRLFNSTPSSSDEMASNGQTLFGPGGDTNKIRSKLNFKSFYVHNRTKTCKCLLIYKIEVLKTILSKNDCQKPIVKDRVNTIISLFCNILLFSHIIKILWLVNFVYNN